MQKLCAWCAKRFDQCFSSRTIILVLTFFTMAFCFNVHTRWAKSIFHFFLLPIQIGMSYVCIRDKAIHMGGVFKLVCVSLLWLLMSMMLNSYWSLGGMIFHWFLFGAWIFALFVPQKTSIQDLHKELFQIGMVFVVLFLPFILMALYSVFTGKVLHVPWDHTPVGVQKAGDYGSRIRIMMNPNKIGIILVLNIFFAIYGIVTRKNKLWKAFFIFVILVNVLASAHAQSRTSIMGLAAAMGMFAFRCVYQKLDNKKLLRILLGVLACVLVFMLVVYGMDWIHQADVSLAKWINNDAAATVGAYRSEEYGTFDAVSSGRGKVWNAVFDLLRKEPLGLAIGYGAEDVMQMAADAGDWPGMAGMVHVHSAYLDCVVRGGIPYLLMVFAFLVCLIRPAWQLGMEKSTEETKGLFVVPMCIVALLVMSVSEVMLFVDRSYTNILFMVMCGYLLHYRNLRKEGRLSA